MLHLKRKQRKNPGNVILLYLCTKNLSDMIFIQFLRYRAWQNEIGHFLPFYSLIIQKIKILKKMKKIHGDIIILKMCTKNYNHMMYGSLDMEWDSFLSFWTIFCTFTPLTLENQNFEKIIKKAWRHYHLTQVYHKWQSWCIVTEIWSVTHRIFCHFQTKIPKNQNLKNHKLKNKIFKDWKKCQQISSF